MISLLLLPISVTSAPSTDTNSTDEVEYWAIVVEGFKLSVDGYETYFYDSLLSNDNWDKSHITFLLYQNATKENIMNSLDWLKSQSDDNDIILIMISAEGNINYVVSDFDIENPISTKELKEKLDVIDYGAMCVILDSCQSGIFGDKIRGENRVVLKSSFRKGLSVDENGGDIGQVCFSRFVADVFYEKIDYNNDGICSESDILRYTRIKMLPNIIYGLTPRGILTTIFYDNIMMGVPPRYWAIMFPLPTICDDYEGELPIVVLSES